MLTEHEGKRQFAYQDSGDKWHIGVGRNIDEGGGLGLSDDEIDFLLENDIVRCMKELANAFPWYSSLDEVRQDVLVMMAFNLGLTRLRGFNRALAACQAGDYEVCAAEMLDSRWAEQIGDRSRVLSTMMATGEYADGNH